MIARCDNSTCRAFIVLQHARRMSRQEWADLLLREEGWMMVGMDPLTFLCPRCAKEVDHDR